MHPKMSVKLAGLVLRSPLIVASGVLGSSTRLIKKVSENPSVGAVVTKTVTYNPRPGYENPTAIDLGFGFLNAMGLPNPGYLEYRKELSEIKDLAIPLIVSIGPSNSEEAAEMVKALNDVSDGFELNLSCPHAEKLGLEVGSDPEKVRSIVSSARRCTTKPLFVKISPNVTDVVEIARAAVEAGVDAVTAINTMKSIAIDVNAGKPVLSNVYGGLSGKAIHPIAVRIVYELYEAIKIPIVGCGGVYDWRDAVELILAGATAVQIGSAIVYSRSDLNILNEIEKGIIEYLKDKGFNNVMEIVGLAHTS
ncbi:MAG: dihydroorotate dehydrogenase [Crenarchaeota archaeon]|nr:dihydroorotate dehydrogenase [Thermoproteota archaeon]MDW8033548.1 dihydroorotate dehydrogenase [Nitrososphaerota archaeon]